MSIRRKGEFELEQSAAWSRYYTSAAYYTSLKTRLKTFIPLLLFSLSFAWLYDSVNNNIVILDTKICF